MARRLAAIFAAEVVSYSRFMSEDEAKTLERLKLLHKDLVKPSIDTHSNGYERIVIKINKKALKNGT